VLGPTKQDPKEKAAEEAAGSDAVAAGEPSLAERTGEAPGSRRRAAEEKAE